MLTKYVQLGHVVFVFVASDAALGGDQHEDDVPALHVLREHPSATVLDVVGMGADREDVHSATSQGERWDHVFPPQRMARASSPCVNNKSTVERNGANSPWSWA